MHRSSRSPTPPLAAGGCTPQGERRPVCPEASSSALAQGTDLQPLPLCREMGVNAEGGAREQNKVHEGTQGDGQGWFCQDDGLLKS